MGNFKKRVMKSAMLLISAIITMLFMNMQVYALPDVTGTWTVEFNKGTRTTMTLRQSGEDVTGTLETTDGSRKQVVGKIAGKTLTLSRDSGLETIQHYRVTVECDRFSGNFWNEGKYPDKGTFTGTRTSPHYVSGSWEVMFKQDTRTTMTLRQSGEDVTGTLETTDGSRKQVVGRVAGKTLTLSRDSGLETIQHYRVTVECDRFSGNFWNEGKYPDKGTFTGTRH
ncbi:MAG: hypothetical protein EPN22_15675 [Nitrospirae bacterium]|nr:MAG: hypothetical protein EPN22_15675 [Nitrospirota bacterium]